MRRLTCLVFCLFLVACPAVRAQEGPAGTVTLPLEDFVKMTGQTASAAAAPVSAPQAHLLSDGRYRVEVGHQGAVLTASQDLTLYSPGWQEVPLLPAGTILSEATLDGRAVPVYEKEGTLRLLARGPGRHQVRVVYHAGLTVEGSARSLEFRPLPGAVARIRLLLPGTGHKVEATPAAPLTARTEAGRTVVDGALPTHQPTRLSWSPRTASLGRPAGASREKTRVTARLGSMIQVSEREIRGRSRVECTVQGEDLDSLVLAVPRAAQVVELTCPELAGWDRVDREASAEIHVALARPIGGNLVLDLTTETPLANPNSTWELPGLAVVGAQRTKGVLGITVSEAMELNPADEPVRARRLDPAELPPEVLGLATRVPVLAYEYHTATPSIRLESRLGKQVALLTAAVDQASGQTLVTAEGKCISTFTWHLRNNQNQYLSIELPQGSRIWSAFVQGRPVKPVEEGRLLKLPLVSSQGAGQDLSTFPVEITFVGSDLGRSWLGSQTLQAPRLTGVPIAQLNWSVFLPQDHRILGFQGTLEPAADEVALPAPTDQPKPEAQVRRSQRLAADRAPAAPQVAGSQTTDGNEEDLAEKSVPVPESAVAEEAEPVAESAMAQMVQTTSQGSFPVRVRVPLEGQAFHFSQLMVADENPTLRVRYYTPNFVQAAGWATLLVVLGAGLGATRGPGGWRPLTGAALALALLGWLVAETPVTPLLTAALQGVGLLALTWSWRHRRWLLDALKTRRASGPERAEEVSP